MLVLSRKIGEQIHIGAAICVRVLEIRGNQVRLGIEAPVDVAVLRSELQQRPVSPLATLRRSVARSNASPKPR
jgi:carbon storage regulator